MLKYGDGSYMMGNQMTDRFCVSCTLHCPTGLRVTLHRVLFQFGCDSSALCTDNTQSFLASTIESSHGFEDKNDGLIGMGFDSLSQQNAPTPFHTLTKNSQCVSKVFAFWLNRNPDDEDGGELTVCGTDPGHYTGNIIYTPITDKRYWQFAVNSVKVYGLTAVSNFQAIADTGSTLIIGPPSDIKQIFSRIGVSYGSSGGTMVSCYGYLPDITFVINSQEFTLSRDQYVVKQNGNCFVGLVGADMDGLWILGDGKAQLEPRHGGC